MHGRTALVTGAGRNLGRSIALAFAARGARVIVNVRSNVEEGTAVVREIEAAGGRAWLAVADVGDHEQVAAMVAEVVEDAGPISYLVSCAAERPRGAFLEVSVEEWDRVIRTNLSGSFYLARSVLPGMVEQDFGRILLIGGPDGQAPILHRPHNVTAKAGLLGLMRTLALEFGPNGITTNVVVPGRMETTFDPATHPTKVDARGEEWFRVTRELLTARGAFGHDVVIDRRGTCEEFAEACMFFASDTASYITGQVLHVSGGMFIQ